MAGLWGLGEGAVPHVINWQVRGVPNADQAAQIAAGAYVEPLWYGPMQQEPYRSASDLADQLSVMDRLRAFLPEAAAVRMPFNINHWGTAGTRFEGTGLRTTTAAFLAAMAQRGVRAHWCLMDGPSQRSSGELPYPAANTQAAWQAWADSLSARQVESHRRLVQWAAANPAGAPVPWAVEAINEPDSYNVMGLRVGDMAWARAIYARHVVAIYEQVYAAAPAPWDAAFYFVGGWNYSANFSGLAVPNAYLPGGVSAIAHIRSKVPAARLCWSVHAYPDWIGGPTQTSVRQNLRRRLGGKAPVGIEGDRIILTETNAQHDTVFRYPPYGGRMSALNLMRNAQWLAEMGIGIGWWTGGNYAQARLVQIQSGPSGVRMDEGWSHANWHYLIGARNNPQVSLGEQVGEVAPTVDQAIQRWVIAGGDEQVELAAAGLVDNNGGVVGITRLLRAHGGRGTCILRGRAGAGNLLYGGDGWAALYGGPAPSIDFLALGRGGGVARSPAALRAVFYGSTHRPGRMYLPPGKSTVVLMEGSDNPTTIVADPQSPHHSVVLGFDAARGDRFSLRGACASAADLRNALSIETVTSLGEDILIRLPGGGSLRFAGGFAMAPTIADYCLDLSAGWYAPGWTEPEDYDPAALLLPAPAPGEIAFDPQRFDHEAGGEPDDAALGGVPARVHSRGDAVIRTWRGDIAVAVA